MDQPPVKCDGWPTHPLDICERILPVLPCGRAEVAELPLGMFQNNAIFTNVYIGLVFIYFYKSLFSLGSHISRYNYCCKSYFKWYSIRSFSMEVKTFWICAHRQGYSWHILKSDSSIKLIHSSSQTVEFQALKLKDLSRKYCKCFLPLKHSKSVQENAELFTGHLHFPLGIRSPSGQIFESKYWQVR